MDTETDALPDGLEDGVVGDDHDELKGDDQSDGEPIAETDGSEGEVSI